MTGETYRFEDYELDTALYRLRRTGEPVHVEPRALDLLSFLIENRSRVVSKIEILDAVWGDRFVTEAALTTGLRTARRAIGDSGDQQRLIRTVHGRGYQFMGQVTVTASSETVRIDHAGSVGSTAEKGGGDRQAIRFCRADDGTRIAYAAVGSGPSLLKARATRSTSSGRQASQTPSTR